MHLYREKVDITLVLKNVIDNYPAGGAVLRELLQNSDDAHATSQIFILDKRTYSKDGLPHPALAECQGPALLAINDSTFQEKDWKALTRIHDSSKSADETQTGKYGLGFRSCYHVTDNPQVLSTTSLLILDPHEEFGIYAGGLRLGGGDFAEYPNLYRPFNIPGAIADIENYNGTAIRLPLRSSERAKTSRIKTGTDAEVTPARVEEWFNHFIETELSVATLFLKHVAKIELRVISDEEDITFASTCIARVHGDNILANRSLNRGRTPEKSHYTLEIVTRERGQTPNRTEWMITQFVRDNVEMEKDLCKVLDRPQAEVAAQMNKDKLLPHLALALPLTTTHGGLSTSLEGRLFSLLPLPIVTGFPLHIHSVFALLSSRQNLRNFQESAGKDSRERLLIEWNRLVFTTILPQAWSYLLLELPQTSSQTDIYAAWPRITGSKEGDTGYWANLPADLLEQAAHHPVWPTIGCHERFQLKDVLVASRNQSDDLIGALQSAGLSLTRPPQHIFDLVSTTSFQSQILSPASACLVLESHIPKLQDLSSKDIKIIAEYIASADQISLFKNVPLVQAVSGAFVTVDPDAALLVSEQEADLFKEMNPGMLARDNMLPTTKALMARSVRRLDVATIVQYLKRFSSNNPSQGNAADGTVAWLCGFWALISSWTEGLDLLNKVREFNAIPTSDGNLRPASARILLPTHSCDPDLLDTLEQLSVPMLHYNMGDTSRAFLLDHGVATHQHDMGFLMEVIRCEGPNNLPSITKQQRHALHDHLKLHLPSYKKQLDCRHIRKLLSLPVFPTLPTGRKGSEGVTPSLETAGSTRYFIDSSVSVIPNLKNVTFIDARACPELIATMGFTDEVKNEVDILQLVLEHLDQWSQQPRQVSEGLVDRFFNRMSDLPSHLHKRICQLPFVDVGGDRVRPPCEIVDPESRMAKLFGPSDQVLPVGRFNERGSGTILTQLRARAFLQTKLSTVVIEERLQNMDRANTLELLKAVDNYYLSQSAVPDSFLPNAMLSSGWIPASGGLHSVHECCDLQAPTRLFLYDLVLPIVDYTVKSPEFRSALGWDTVRVEVTIEQMKRAVSPYNTSEENRRHRVNTIINELADCLHERACSVSDLEDLRLFLRSHPWIPMPDSGLELAERCIIDSVDLGPLSRLRRLPSSLREDQKVIRFLKKFGVCQRPSMAILLSELEYLRELGHSSFAVGDLVKSSVAILAELVTPEHIAGEERTRIWLPTAIESQELDLFQNIHTVCYNDLRDSGHTPPQGMFFAHPAVSLELADKLLIDRLSDLEFDMVQVDEFESFDVGEDLTRRIQNVLKAYREDASSNEWIANADDASASTVSIICSEQHFQIRRAPSPSLAEYLEGPSLIVHNSGIFSEKDFEGLQRVGLGGKSEKPDSIGRFGLGALSFYHFGDVIMLVSGPSVVFLDPSRENLPRELGGARRSGMKLTIRECRRVFPDVFLAINAVEGFNSSADRYEGTIFLVPLRSEAHALTSKISTVPVTAQSVIDRFRGAFFANAKKSLFFTRMSSVRASHRLPSGTTNSLWGIDATRGEARGKNGMKYQGMMLTVRAASEDFKGPPTHISEDSEWLLTSRAEMLPLEFGSLVSKNRLSAMISAALAVQVLPPPAPSSHLLFATLPLPLGTKLNTHIHSQFILSDDRQHIQFDSSPQPSRNLDTAFNAWLLSTLVPHLLLQTIGVLNADKDSRPAARRLWPDRTCIEAASSFDNLLARSFYQMLPQSQEELFETASGHIALPSDVVVGVSLARPVEALLEKLYPKTFAPCPFDWSLVSPSPTALQQTSIKAASPTFVRSALQSHAHRVLEHAMLDDVDVDGLVCYLLAHGESLVDLPLLRLQNGHMVRFGGHNDPNRLVYPYNSTVATIFGPHRVAMKEGSGGLNSETVEAILIKGNLNLVPLNAAGLKMLLARSGRITGRPSVWPSKPEDATLLWIGEFWNCCLEGRFGIKITPDDLADLPLFPTVDGPLISLRSCSGMVTFWRAHEGWDTRTRDILQTLLRLGVRVIDMEYYKFELSINARYSKLSSRLDVALVLEFLSSLRDKFPAEEIVKKVPQKSWIQLAAWIRHSGMAAVKELLSSHPNIASIPLWEARRISPDSNSVAVKPFEDIVMLPERASLSLLAKFMDGGETWFCESSRGYSIALRNLLPNGRVLGPVRLLERLRVIPQRLDLEEVPDFLDFLQMLKGLGAPNEPFIPNHDLVLCHPRDLYHGGTPLFALAFQYQPGRLVSKSFVGLGEWFSTLGVSKDVTLESLIAAATAIDEFIRQGQGQVIKSALELAFSHLDRVSWVFDPLSSEDGFERIRGLRCMVRGPERASDSKLQELAPPLPQVLTLDQLVLKQHYLCAWTQRAQFSVDPPNPLKAVFPGIGVPTAGEVVAHLVVLANAIQRKPDLGLLLTADLQGTYSWLDRHSEAAHEHLQRHKDQRLFRNVDKGSNNMGIWHSAKMMWLNITFDNAKREQYSVKTYMGQFGTLLRAAGVREFPVRQYKVTGESNNSLPPSPYVESAQSQNTSCSECGSTDSPSSQTELVEKILSNLNRFRAPQGKLTDVIFFPRSYPRSGEGLRAHRSVLAASSSYFEDLFTGGGYGGSESASPLEPVRGEILGSRLVHFQSFGEPKQTKSAKREPDVFPHVEIAVPEYSFEVVECALYYIYTTKFKSPHGPTNSIGHAPAENSTDMLATLVNLLRLSHKWCLNELKLDTEEFIRNSGLIMPWTLNYLIDECEKVEAHGLLRHCVAIKEEAQNNGWEADDL